MCVRSPIAAKSPPDEYRLHAEERHYLQCVVLDCAWLFPGSLDAEALQSSLAALLRNFPILAGRRCGRKVVLDNSGVPFSMRTQAGSAIHFVGKSGAPNNGPGSLADRRVLKTPVLTVRVTHFEDGTSALGVAMPHDVVDGFSLYKVVQLWSILHTDGPDAPLPYHWDRGVLQSSGATAPAATPAGAASAIPAVLSGWGMRLVASLAQRKRRARVHLTAAEVREMKVRFGSEGSTTSEVLTARLLKLGSAHVLGRSANVPFNFGFNVNLRGRGGMPSDLLANCSSSLAAREMGHGLPAPPSKMSDTEVLECVRGTLRGVRTHADEITSAFARHVAELERGVYWRPWFKPPIAPAVMQLNLQQGFTNIAQVHFGAGRCIDFVPWAAGDAVQVLPRALDPLRREVADTARTNEPLAAESALPPAIGREASLLIKLVGPSESAHAKLAGVGSDGLLSAAQASRTLKRAHPAEPNDDVVVAKLLCSAAHLADEAAHCAKAADVKVSVERLCTAHQEAVKEGGIDVYIKPVGLTGISRCKQRMLEGAAFKSALIRGTDAPEVSKTVC